MIQPRLTLMGVKIFYLKEDRSVHLKQDGANEPKNRQIFKALLKINGFKQ